MTFLQTSTPRKLLIAAYLRAGNRGDPSRLANVTCPPSSGLSQKKQKRRSMRKFAALTLIPLLLAAPLHAQKKAATKPKPPAIAKPAPLVPLNPQERAQQLLNRFTFGPRPGDLEQVLVITPEKWFEQQLNPASIPDPVLDKRLNDYPTLNLQSDQALLVFPDHGAIQQVAEGKRPYPADPNLAAMYEVQVYKYNTDLDAKKINANGQPNITPPTEAEAAAQKKADQETAAHIAGDLFTLPKNQRMAALIKLPVPDRIAFTTYVAGDQKNLFLNDFNPREREIYIGKDSDQWYTTSYERDAIRKHALGKFRDLLIATATSPAMMVYLDNWLSIGPDSIANGVNHANPNSKKGNRGLNENYGREVMELHTVGVDSGYTQADVTALSAILTGWTVDRPNQGGPFTFDPKKHEPGPKQWLGHTIGATSAGAPEPALSLPKGSAASSPNLGFISTNP